MKNLNTLYDLELGNLTPTEFSILALAIVRIFQNPDLDIQYLTKNLQKLSHKEIQEILQKKIEKIFSEKSCDIIKKSLQKSKLIESIIFRIYEEILTSVKNFNFANIYEGIRKMLHYEYNEHHLIPFNIFNYICHVISYNTLNQENINVSIHEYPKKMLFTKEVCKHLENIVNNKHTFKVTDFQNVNFNDNPIQILFNEIFHYDLTRLKSNDFSIAVYIENHNTYNSIRNIKRKFSKMGKNSWLVCLIPKKKLLEYVQRFDMFNLKECHILDKTLFVKENEDKCLLIFDKTETKKNTTFYVFKCPTSIIVNKKITLNPSRVIKNNFYHINFMQDHSYSKITKNVDNKTLLSFITNKIMA